MTRDVGECGDGILLQRWKEGDQRAGIQLCRRHHDTIARFFISKLGPDIDDLVQQTFLALVEGQHRFRGDCSVRTLLFAIARNILRRHFRNRKQRQRHFVDEQVSVAASDTSPSQALVAARSRSLLLRCLRKLSLDNQIMLELYYWEGLSLKEIKKIYRLRNENTVKTRLRRARLRLERLMAELEGRPDEPGSISSISAWVVRMQGCRATMTPITQ